MNRGPMTKSAVALFLSSSVILTSQMVTVAQAGMISTDTAISRYSAHADRDFLISELDREEVRREIVAAGIDPAEAEKRLRALSDEEVAELVQQMDSDAAGGDPFGSLVGAMMTVFIILLVTDLLCLTKAFPFTRCAR